MTHGTAEAQIRRLAADGTLPRESAERLLDEVAQLDARDRVLRAELAERGARRARSGARQRGLRWLVVGAVLGAVLGGGVARFVVDDGGAPAGTAPAAAVGDPDAVIAEIESSGARPASAATYRRLADAYTERHRRSGAPADRAAAARAAARAARLGERFDMRERGTIFALVSVAAGAAVVGLLVAWLHNGLVRRDEDVERRWAQVEVALERRLDLVPPLVEVVRGYAEHERDTLLAVTEARASALGALAATGHVQTAPGRAALGELARSQEVLSGALGRLVAIAEQHPSLRAAEAYTTLADQLEGTENRIAVERQRYNDAVGTFNARLRTFPSNLVGSLFDVEPRAYFEAEAAAARPVPISLRAERPVEAASSPTAAP